MVQEEPAPPEILKELVAFSDEDIIPAVIGTDANAHHTVWDSTNVNPKGLELLMYCVSANLYFCNVSNKPTFRTKVRGEVLDVTLINRNAWNCVRDWHVSDVPSFPDHMYIRYTIQSSTKRTKMIRNVRRTCWNKYASELDRRLYELNRAPVNISSIDDIRSIGINCSNRYIEVLQFGLPTA